jgi:CHASE2 domain-containing sensor protein
MTAVLVLRRIGGSLAIAALAATVAFGIFRLFPFMGTAERWTTDYRIATVTAPEPQHPEIVVAAINEETLSSFPYRSPIDRRFLAKTIEALAAKGAKALLIDVLLDQETEEDKDDELRAALAALKIPFSISYSDSPLYVTDEQREYLDEFVAPQWRGLADIEPDIRDGTIRFVPEPRDGRDGTRLLNVAARVAERLGVAIPETRRIIAWRGQPDAETPPFRIFP